MIGNALPENAKKTFYDLLYLDVLRGEDSTGVAAISNAYNDKTEIELFKSLGGATDLFYEHNLWKKGRALTTKPVDVFVGHNRFATQGAVTSDNAHPFEFENVVGAHNGTVNKWSMRDFQGYKEFDIDSKIIYSHLSHTQNIEDVWKDADGALALSWWDKAHKQLNLIRNDQRPLFFCYSKDNKQVFWASEFWMLHVALSRQGVERLDILACKPNVLYTFATTDAKEVFHTETLVPPFVEKARQNWQNTQYWRGSYDYWDEKEDRAKPAKVTPPKKGANLIITEFHDSPAKPLLVGVLQEGELIKINIPINKYQEVKNRVTKPDSNGFFFAKNVYKNVLSKEDFWCNWGDMNFISIKPDVRIIRKENGGFQIQGPQKDALSAPWFNSEVRLTREAFEKAVHKGCDCCQDKVVWEEKDTLLWVNRDTFYCVVCKDTPLVKSYLSSSQS